MEKIEELRIPNIPKKVKVIEVCSRDGFQIETKFIPTRDKIQFINALSHTGVSSIEVTSFVHPKAVPQLADAEEVMMNIERVPGVNYSVLVPNLKGAERAAKVKADEWGLFMSASDSHGRANLNKGLSTNLDQEIKALEPIVEFGREEGVCLNIGLSVALGCPYEGRIPLERVVYLVEGFESIGIDIVDIADSAGVADPAVVYSVMKALIDRFPKIQFILHTHNTRNMATANILAAMQAGVTAFDSSVGGLGGCPYVPTATGNIATEDLVHMLEMMGIKCDVNLDKVLDVSRQLETLLNRKLTSSAVLSAGKSLDLKKAPEHQIKIGECKK